MATTAAQMKQKAKKAPEKDTFKWTGTDKRGRKVSGEMGGANIALIRAQLRARASPQTRFAKNRSPYSVNEKSPSSRVTSQSSQDSLRP